MRSRRHHLNFWLNDSEYVQFQRQLTTANMKVDPYLRKLALGVELRPRPPDEYYAELIRQLAAIGNNLNQLAHIANINKSVSAGEINWAVEDWRRAWRLLKEIL